MPTKNDIVTSLIILSLFAIFYGFIGFVGFQAEDNTYISQSITFIVCALVSIGSIIGIKNKIKWLLWLGMILGFVKILDGILSIVNKFIFGDNILIGGHLVIAVLYLIPIKVMIQILKQKKVAI